MTKILLIEDDPLMSRMYQKIFTFEGYETEVAEDGQAGIERARVFQPELILLDMMMPKLNGFEVLKNLKSHPETKSIVIVLLTNLGVQKEIDKALAGGAVKYIEKAGHEPREVVDIVNQILSERPKKS